MHDRVHFRRATPAKKRLPVCEDAIFIDFLFPLFYENSARGGTGR